LKAATALTKESSLMTSLSFVYFAISVGVALQVGGANWDIIWHGIVNVESFFTPPHTVIYSGVALAIIAILFGIIKSIKSNNHLRYHHQQQQQQQQEEEEEEEGKQSSSFSLKLLLSYIPFPLRLAAAGSLMQLFSGRFDYWWHSNFGFDGLLSPPHFLLVVGMVMSILGALIGIYNLKNLTTATSSSEVRIQETKERNQNSHFINISFLFAYAIFWMVAVNTVFMFTLPYSKGQYFDFNPDPFAAIITASLLIPLITGMIFFIVTRTNKTPFMFTLITAFFMVIQSTATIISNTYFVTLYPLYLLNILSALAADVIVLQYGRRRKAKETTEIKSSKIIITATTTNTTDIYRSIIAPAIVSIFFITLFFPWSVNVYKTYFGIHLNTFGSASIFGQLLWTIIIPVIMPIAAVMSIVGSYIMFKLMNTAKTRKRIFI
jgi:hypothetical protein